jgi:glycosyltransferase involved in cell wall biosynthesis
VKVAWVVNDLQLSGGIGVVVQHARGLHHRQGWDVWLVLARPQDDPHWAHEALAGLRVASLDEAREETFDIAVSTWWETVWATFELRAHRYASFVQSLEDRFYRQDEIERLGASLMLDLPVSFLTEARWIRDTLADLRPDAPCFLVRNGIDKAVFAPVDRVEPRTGGPLRILVEGYASTWFKGVNEAIAAVGEMAEPRHLTVVAPDRTGLRAEGADEVVGPIPQRELADRLARTDVVLKLSQVEGMFGPPLEGFHRGATCVTTEVTGHEEYVEHGVNALVVDWDDRRGTARQLDLLARDRMLLHRLRCGALETARTWPDWDRAGELMAVALRAVRDAPAPAPYAHVPRLLGDLRAGMEAQRLLLQERRELDARLKRAQRLERLPGIKQALRVKRSRYGRAAIRVARPVKRRLLGS